ncbi:MAG: family 78 glycoside hydrolase catalytic domain [Candidatus Hydrogenedentota bacterium]
MTPALEHKSLTKTPIAPVAFENREGCCTVDFGKVWFGTLRFRLAASSSHRSVIIRLGEVLSADGRIDRNPPGTARFRELKLDLLPGKTLHELPIPGNPDNTGPRTIRMPSHIGEVLPFRYAEIEDAPHELTRDSIRLVAAHYPYDAGASFFDCSDKDLKAVWELSRHTMIATSFCGIFVDGDRERYPREADAYINQLGYYCVDAEYGLARHTHEFMIQHPSRWTEWLFHSIFMAWMDLLYTGDDTSVQRFYADLEARLLLPLARDDGLISTVVPNFSDDFLRSLCRYEGEHVRGHPRLLDIVDWPRSERDSYEFLAHNTVVNSFHLRALVLMSRIAYHTRNGAAAQRLVERTARVRRSFQRTFFDDRQGLYVDGEGSDHASLHANVFPLVFGLVPPPRKARVLKFIKGKGMACSVYAAQYLLEALFREGEADYALALMTADTDRSWKHMIDQGATITWEAWDVKYKANMDRNHAWGAAPANILPRYVLGVRPREIGAKRIVIAPQPGSLSFVRGKVPIQQGSVLIEYRAKKKSQATLEVDIPEGTEADVFLGNEKVASVGTGMHRFQTDG